MVIHPNCTGLGRSVVLNNGPKRVFIVLRCLGLKMAHHPSMLFGCDIASSGSLVCSYRMYVC
jgi:hypothetical protein